MKTFFSILRLVLLVLVAVLMIATSFEQIYVLSQGLSKPKLEVELVPLSGEEQNQFCSFQKCNYYHKVNLDGRWIKIEGRHSNFRNKIWLFLESKNQIRLATGMSVYLWEYLFLDLFFIVYSLYYWMWLKKENGKPNSSVFRKTFQKVSKDPKLQNQEIDESPLPPFGLIFAVGFFHIVSGSVLSAILHFFLPREGWVILLVFAVSIAFSYFIYRLSGKRLGIFLSSILCFVSTFAGKDLIYAFNITHDTSLMDVTTEEVYTLEPGTIDIQHMGVQVDREIRSGRSSPRNYFYHFVVPWIRDSQPKDNSQWLVLEQKWAEDPAQLDLFWESWKTSLQAVQVYDENWSRAISISAKQHGIDISEGVALLKPILSLEEEAQSKWTSVLIWNGILCAIWFAFGSLRLYAGSQEPG